MTLRSHPKVVSVESINKELLELEKEHIAEEEARDMETSGEEQGEEAPKRFTVKGLVGALAGLHKLCKKFKNMDPPHTHTEMFSLIEQNVHGHGLHIMYHHKIHHEKKRNRPSKPPWTYF